MGRVQVDPDKVVTQPEMPAAGTSPKGVARSEVSPRAERATVRGETKWFSTPPAGNSIATQPPRSARVAIRVDDLGGAVGLGRNALDLLRRTVPRVLQSKRPLADAPLDHREGFVLALVDGNTSVQGLIDVAGMPDDDLISVLQRLRRLGLITLG